MEPTAHLALRKIHHCLPKLIDNEKSNQEQAGNNRKTPDVVTGTPCREVNSRVATAPNSQSKR